MNLTVKLFTRKVHHNEAEEICDHTKQLLKNYDYYTSTFDPKATFDVVLNQCAEICNITPVYIPLFALWHPGTQSWMKLSATLDSSDVVTSPMNIGDEHQNCLEFRVRYLVRSEMQLSGQKKVAKRWSLPGEDEKPFLNDSVVSYLFRQQREDFLQDKIELRVESDKTEAKDAETEIIAAALGVAVLDMICIAKEMNTDVRTISQRVKFKSLLPKSCRDRLSTPNMNICNRFRIKKKFRHYLKFFSPTVERWQSMGHTITHFQRRYLLNLELLCASYGVEQYNLAEHGFIRVSADSGIVLHSSESEYSVKWCDFSELTDMNLQVSRNEESTMYIVSLSKINGAVSNFALKSVSSAEDLASCIDGYYRLVVDAHHYLCREVCSKSFLENLQNGCHGPISCAFAEGILRERNKSLLKVGDCVLRQSQESHREYYVNTICQKCPLETRNFKLNYTEDGLGMYGHRQSHQYRSLGDLLKACKGGKYNGDRIPFNTDQIIYPQNKMKSNLIVRLCSRQEDDGHPDNNTLLNVQPRITMINFNDYHPKEDLGHGSFTTVRKYYRKDDNKKYVVLKSVFSNLDHAQKHHADESLQESTAMLNCINHVHIVQQIGMALAYNMVVLEYIPNRSITDYLKRPRTVDVKIEWSKWFLQVLWQMTHACHYLEDLSLTHGNLCGKNIMLWNDFPPHIKVSDPGVKTMCKFHWHRNVIVPVLEAPWLACEFCYIATEPEYPVYPTIEGDKWSFATTMCEILNFGRIDIETNNAYYLTENMIKAYKSEEVLPIPDLINANEELSALIKGCWHKEKDKRPSFQKILRELGSTLSSDYILPSIGPEQALGATSHSPNAVCSSITDDLDLATYEDEKLMLHSHLGEGHFGNVRLYVYDQYRNGITKYVAVKSLKKSSNKPGEIIDFLNEVKTMRKLNHKYVVRLLGITTPSNRIVMEYLRDGSLLDHMKKMENVQTNGRALRRILLQFSSQISQGMLALQSKRLIHRDLALRNILLSRDSPNSPLYIKISDFGLSRVLSEDVDYYLGNLEEFPANWYAPECLWNDKKKAFRFESDVWSFGITIWEMFSYGKKPTYPDIPTITQANLIKLQEHLRKNNRLARTRDCPVEVYDLMQRCWMYEPTKRISFAELRDEFDRLIPIAENLAV